MPYLPSCMQERDRTESREGVVRRGGYPSLLLTRHRFISLFSSKCVGTGSGFYRSTIVFVMFQYIIYIKDKIDENMNISI
jgi:hypothetical protein